MLYNQSLFPTSRLPSGTADGFTILQSGGYVRSVGQGFIALSSLGTVFLQHFATRLRDQFERFSFSEIALPLLQLTDLWEESGRYAKYGPVLAETSLGEDARGFVIHPTQEEAVLDSARSRRISSSFRFAASKSVNASGTNRVRRMASSVPALSRWPMPTLFRRAWRPTAQRCIGWRRSSQNSPRGSASRPERRGFMEPKAVPSGFPPRPNSVG